MSLLHQFQLVQVMGEKGEREGGGGGGGRRRRRDGEGSDAGEGGLTSAILRKISGLCMHMRTVCLPTVCHVFNRLVPGAYTYR